MEDTPKVPTVTYEIVEVKAPLGYEYKDRNNVNHYIEIVNIIVYNI